MSSPIDLRSDTVTKPSAAMREAIATADVGDDMKREDPTVAELEDRVAELLGQDAALFVPTATMANELSLRVLGRPGDEVLAERFSHIFLYELGGPAVHSGLVMKAIEGGDGDFTVAQLESACAPAVWYRSPSSILCVENTHAESGGQVWDPDWLAAVVGRARDLNLRLHLDGARLLNAAIASGVAPKSIAAQFDTVTLCLSKGLGCPAGALLAGRADFVEQARRQRMLFGGAMRQVGILAAAGLYALDHNVERLAEDHANAQLLAGLVAVGLGYPVSRVDTNIVLIDLAPLGLQADDALPQLAAAGVLLSTIVKPGFLRAVTHLDVSRAQVADAARRIGKVLSALRSTSGS